ncbi:hypothetical protein AX774_g5395 [Zancudomyces culisetae]|uniref:Uncharacterized protein n=1 Tax=Zancudomyces culisetae TaxID=1213189 RepID=A0A1R1PJN0_ZANCU|nr:hypothetical protein AX774_g5395 [Zancudomyces culisetae]|eukprot:OMH81147.1 hypothetical protein AX774_g5395 [Zancudomyces culisetae]
MGIVEAEGSARNRKLFAEFREESNLNKLGKINTEWQLRDKIIKNISQSQADSRDFQENVIKEEEIETEGGIENKIFTQFDRRGRGYKETSKRKFEFIFGNGYTDTIELSSSPLRRNTQDVFSLECSSSPCENVDRDTLEKQRDSSLTKGINSDFELTHKLSEMNVLKSAVGVGQVRKGQYLNVDNEFCDNNASHTDGDIKHDSAENEIEEIEEIEEFSVGTQEPAQDFFEIPGELCTGENIGVGGDSELNDYVNFSEDFQENLIADADIFELNRGYQHFYVENDDSFEEQETHIAEDSVVNNINMHGRTDLFDKYIFSHEQTDKHDYLRLERNKSDLDAVRDICGIPLATLKKHIILENKIEDQPFKLDVSQTHNVSFWDLVKQTPKSDELFSIRPAKKQRGFFISPDWVLSVLETRKCASSIFGLQTLCKVISTPSSVTLNANHTKLADNELSKLNGSIIVVFLSLSLLLDRENGNCDGFNCISKLDTLLQKRSLLYHLFIENFELIGKVANTRMKESRDLENMLSTAESSDQLHQEHHLSSATRKTSPAIHIYPRWSLYSLQGDIGSNLSARPVDVCYPDVGYCILTTNFIVK